MGTSVRELRFFFFNDTATTEIYALSLRDALPIYLPPSVQDRLQDRRARFREQGERQREQRLRETAPRPDRARPRQVEDRKSTRLNSSHANISYAVFCLTKNLSREMKMACLVAAPV